MVRLLTRPTAAVRTAFEVRVAVGVRQATLDAEGRLPRRSCLRWTRPGSDGVDLLQEAAAIDARFFRRLLSGRTKTTTCVSSN